MTTHTEDVRRLESEFAAAMAQMYAVGNGLARLRAQLEREGATVASPAPSSLPAPAVPTPAQPRVVPPPPRTPGHGSPLPPMAPVQTAPSREPWWQRTSLVSLLIGGAGALVTLLGVVFLIQLAIAVGIFGPLPRVIAGALVAVALAVAAALVRRRNHTGSLALAATSVAAAYLDIMGATLTYHFLPDVVGLALATLVGALGLSVARWWRSEFLGCVAVLGVALLGPGLAHGPGLVTSAFFVVLTLASWPAQVGRRWHVLELARVVPTAIMVTLAALEATGRSEQLGHVALALVLAVLILGTSAAAFRTRVAPRQVGVLAVLGWLPLLVASAHVPGWLGLALAVGATGLAALAWLVARPDDAAAPLHRLTPYLAAAVALGVHVAAVHDGPGHWVPARLALGALVLVLAALVVRDRWVSLAAATTGVTAAATTTPFIGLLAYRGWSGDFGVAEPLALGLVAATCAVATRLQDGRRTNRPWAVPVGIAALGWTLAAITAAVTALGVRLGMPHSGFVAGHALASVLLLACAVALLLTRRVLRGTARVHVSIGLASVAVLKLVLFDATALSGLFLVGGFLAAGPILLTMGVVYARALAAARRESSEDGAPGTPVENRPAGSPDIPSVDVTGPTTGPTP